MISVDEKTEAELEKDISEAVGALGDGWELRFMLSRHILTVVVKVEVPSLFD